MKIILLLVCLTLIGSVGTANARSQDDIVRDLEADLESEANTQKRWTDYLRPRVNLRIQAIGVDRPTIARNSIVVPFERGEPGYQSGAIARLQWENDRDSWWRYQIHVRGAITSGSTFFQNSTGAALESNQSQAEQLRLFAWETDDTIAETDDRVDRVFTEIDYFNIRLRYDAFDLTLGRQAITFGHTYFWSPINWLTPFSATDIDRVYAPGIDAARLEVSTSPLSGFEIVFANGENDDLRDMTYLGRFFGTYENVTADVILGRVLDEYRIGFGASGELFGAGVRGELSWHEGRHAVARPPRLSRVRDFIRWTIQSDYRFATNTYVSAEFHFNGPGTIRDVFYIRRPELAVGPRRHYVGLRATQELHPLLTVGMSVIGNIDDYSALIAPELNWSTGNRSELIAGAYFPVNSKFQVRNRTAEYGLAPYATVWVRFEITV